MAIFGAARTVRAQSPAGPAFARALAYVEELLTPGSEPQRGLLALAAGGSVRIDLGEGVHAVEQAYLTRGREEGRWESHLRHADLQVLVAGEELIEVAEAARLTAEEDLTPGRDVVLYAPAAASGVLRLRAGDAAVLFPADAHLAGLDPGRRGLVHKAVLKIPVR